MSASRIDTNPQFEIMTPEEVAQFLRKSLSWVYKNWQTLGGVKRGGSLFFPSQEDLYERLFQEGQRVAIRLHAKGQEAHPSLVQNQNRGQTGRNRKKKGGARATDEGGDPNRHGLLGVGEQKT